MSFHLFIDSKFYFYFDIFISIKSDVGYKAQRIENRCHFLSLIKSIDVKDDFPTSYLCKQPASLTVKFPEVRKRKGTETESGLGQVGFEIWLDTKRFPIVFYILKVFQSQTPNPTSPQKDLCD